MNSFFPINEAVKSKNIVSFIIAIFLYLVILGVVGFFVNCIGWIPIIGWATRVVSGIFGLYCFIGMIAALGKYIR